MPLFNLYLLSSRQVNSIDEFYHSPNFPPNPSWGEYAKQASQKNEDSFQEFSVLIRP